MKQGLKSLLNIRKSSDMRLFIFLLCIYSWYGGAGGSKILCSVQEYVQAGLEFEDCQKLALDAFDVGSNPCPSLSTMVKSCASSVKFCFSERGYQRGLKILYDSMALNYPEVNSCNILEELNSTDVTELDRGEQCSISQEIALTQVISQCSNKIQGDMASALSKHGIGGRDPRAPLCDALLKIRQECMESRLSLCYDGHDYRAHLAYLLEALKVSGNVIATHLVNVTDVPDCPAFLLNGVLAEEEENPSSSYRSVVTALSICIVVIVLAFALLVGWKARLMTRVKAWIGNKPYTDFVKETSAAAAGGGSGWQQQQQQSPNETAMDSRGSECASTV